MMRARREERWVVVRLYQHFRASRAKSLDLFNSGFLIHRRHWNVQR